MQFEVHLTFTINKLKLILNRSGVARMVRAHTVLHTWSWVRGPPMLVDLHKCASISIKNTQHHSWHQAVSRCCTRGIHCIQASMQVRDPPWLWNPGQTLPEVRNRGIIDSAKWCLLKIRNKNKILGQLYQLFTTASPVQIHNARTNNNEYFTNSYFQIHCVGTCGPNRLTINLT